MEIQLEWIGLSWYWVAVSWFILEYWISNWNKILDQLSPIGKFSWTQLVWYKWIRIRLILFFPIVNFTSQYISNWKFYFPTNVQLEPILSSWEKVQSSPIRSKMSWKKVQLNPIESDWIQLCQVVSSCVQLCPIVSSCVQLVLCQFPILDKFQLENWIGNFGKGEEVEDAWLYMYITLDE